MGIVCKLFDIRALDGKQKLHEFNFQTFREVRGIQEALKSVKGELVSVKRSKLLPFEKYISI